MESKPICSLGGCENEAFCHFPKPKWVKVKGDNFYLCEEHHNTESGLSESDDDGCVHLLNPLGAIERYEVVLLPEGDEEVNE